MKTEYTTRLVGAKVVVLRLTHFYPKGTVVVKCRSQAAADNWIERQTAEDKENRCRRVQDYLAERAARSVPVSICSDQLSLF